MNGREIKKQTFEVDVQYYPKDRLNQLLELDQSGEALLLLFTLHSTTT